MTGWSFWANRVDNSVNMGEMCAKFDEDTLRGLVSMVFTYVHCDLDLWPMTMKINRYHSLIMDNLCARFDENTLNILVSMVLTRLFPYMSIVTLSFDPWPWKSIRVILSSWTICVPGLLKILHSTVWSVWCSQGYKIFLKTFPIFQLITIYKRTSCVCETLMPPAATKTKMAIFRIKFTVKVTRSATLVSPDRVSLVEYACWIWSVLSLMVQKLWPRLKFWYRLTESQTDSHRLTDRQDKN